MLGVNKTVLIRSSTLKDYKQFLFPVTVGFKHEKSFSIISKHNQKLSYFNDPGIPLVGATIGNILDKAAIAFGQRDAIVVCESNVRKNFIQLKQDVDNFAAGLLSVGIKPGDRIGILSPNNYEWVVTQLSAAKAGLILVNINPAYQVRELEHCIHKVGLRCLVSSERFKTTDFYELLRTVIPSLSISEPGKIADKYENLTHVIMIPTTKRKFAGAFNFWDIPKTIQDLYINELDELQEIIQFDDPANIQFTSGTTGSPKGATLSHYQLINNINTLGRRMGYHEKAHRICLNVPLYHAFGCVGGTMASIFFGACQVLPAPTFSAKSCAEAVHNEKCTSIYGTPTMYIDVLNLKNFNIYDFSSLSTGVMGGASCPAELVKAVIKKLNVSGLTICYGTTETGPGISQSKPEDPMEKRVSTAGKVFGHSEIKVVDPVTGHILPCGTPGELWVRGAFAMLGYWNDTEKTKESMTKDRWFKTGDIATTDADGYVKIVGRIKDVIIRGGENIYPREIEDFLITHPKIAEVYVVGVPSERLGEEVCSWVKLKYNEKMTDKEVIDYCKGKLAKFKIPRYVKFSDKFPMTVSGKVKKFELKEISIKELGL